MRSFLLWRARLNVESAGASAAAAISVAEASSGIAAAQRRPLAAKPRRDKLMFLLSPDSISVEFGPERRPAVKRGGTERQPVTSAISRARCAPAEARWSLARTV